MRYFSGILGCWTSSFPYQKCINMKKRAGKGSYHFYKREWNNLNRSIFLVVQTGFYFDGESRTQQRKEQ